MATQAQVEILTRSEAADLLKLSESTLDQQIKSGRLSALKIGRAVRIRREDLDRFLESAGAQGGREAYDEMTSQVGSK